MRFARAALTAIAALWVPAGAAWGAEGYGELRHFGSSGVGHGQFKFTKGTRAFGVDGSDSNAVYVGDEVKRGEYRIQKLTSTGAFVAATALLKPPAHAGIEGIAVDPALRRVYMLALEKRAETLLHNPKEAAAGTLYAFSTEPLGEALQPAAGAGEGVLSGPTAFHSQSDVLADALLSPRGIAVDPITHEVIVMGVLDEGEELSSFAFQRIDSSTGALGERYVDHSGLLTPESSPNSPVVSPGGAIYVEQHEPIEIEGVSRDVAQLVRIPSDFSSVQAPTPFIRFLSLGPHESDTNAVVQFANGSGESLSGGGGLSLAGEAAGHSIVYAEARVFEDPLKTGEGAYYTGVLAFDEDSDLEGSELGWTGGQSKQVSESCAIGFGGETAPLVAGGAQRTVFVLDPKFAHVLEFGPGGSGCPTAEAGELTAQAGGAPVTGTIQGGTEVTLSTGLTRANALSVEWDFGEGEAEPLVVSQDEYQHTQVVHTFEQGGELTVTETIHTDNLATPTIVRTVKISVSVKHLAPDAVLSGPISAQVGQAATFDGSASWDPNGAPGSTPIGEYRYDFGDGTVARGEAAEVQHAYAQAGVYTVKLTVLNGYGLESQASSIDVTVVPAPSAQPEPPPSELPSGGLPEALPAGPSGPLGGPPPSPPNSQPQPVPDVTLHAGSLTASAAGTLGVPLGCPAGESGCAGTIVLRTASPVRAPRSGIRHGRPSGAVLVLASGRFSLAGGQRRTVSLRLTAAARALLAHGGPLRARATIQAHDPAGATRTNVALVRVRFAAGVRRAARRAK